MSTPHNQANIGDIAKTVLMPGDPLRAKFIAETFLENPVMFNTVRNMFGYTTTALSFYGMPSLPSGYVTRPSEEDFSPFSAMHSRCH